MAAGSLIALLFVVGVVISALIAGVQALFVRFSGWIWVVLIALVSAGIGVFSSSIPACCCPCSACLSA